MWRTSWLLIRSHTFQAQNYPRTSLPWQRSLPLHSCRRDSRGLPNSWKPSLHQLTPCRIIRATRSRPTKKLHPPMLVLTQACSARVPIRWDHCKFSPLWVASSAIQSKRSPTLQHQWRGLTMMRLRRRSKTWNFQSLNKMMNVTTPSHPSCTWEQGLFPLTTASWTTAWTARPLLASTC